MKTRPNYCDYIGLPSVLFRQVHVSLHVFGRFTDVVDRLINDNFNLKFTLNISKRFYSLPNMKRSKKVTQLKRSESNA